MNKLDRPQEILEACPALILMVPCISVPGKNMFKGFCLCSYSGYAGARSRSHTNQVIVFLHL